MLREETLPKDSGRAQGRSGRSPDRDAGAGAAAGVILIVEDEADLVSTLEYNFEQAGFRTRSALTGRAALELAAQEPAPDLVLLDLMLPDMSGTEVCRALRGRDRTRKVPILILSAKGEEIDRVVGFELGADDYVVKPFSIRELLLRVKAILRRGEAGGSEPEEIQFGRLRLDAAAHRVWLEQDEIALTALEFRLLRTLLARRGRVQTRETLLQDVWGIDTHVTTRTVDTHVKRLRQKLGAASEYIETLRGVGYRCRADPDQAGP